MDIYFDTAHKHDLKAFKLCLLKNSDRGNSQISLAFPLFFISFVDFFSPNNFPKIIVDYPNSAEDLPTLS